MTRISSSPIAALEAERATDRAPAASGGAPFRAALRAAGKDKATAKPAGNDDIYTIASQSPIAGAAPIGEAARGATGDGSLADIIAASIDDPASLEGASLARPETGRTARIPRLQGARGVEGGGEGGSDVAGEVLLDTMLANAGLAGPQIAAPPPPPPAVVDDSPVATWVAASVARAIGSLRGTAGGSASAPAAAATADPAQAPHAATSATPGDVAMSAATPLEQAVHDLIGRVVDRDHKGATASEADAPRDVEAAPLPVLAAPAAPIVAAHEGRASTSAPVHAVREPQLPEPPANPSHVHLVLDDGAERTVVTVAVRGSEVHVALRSHDDATAAALARNAASLDHAMRARGLELGDLTTEREPRDQRPPRDSEPRERPARDAEPFTLEETP